MRRNDDIELKIDDTTTEAIQEEERSRDEAAEMREQARKAIQMIKETVREEDPKLTPTLTLRTILGGDFLTADMVRRNIWLFVLMVIFTIVYVAVRYQCQQDMIAIDKLENELQRNAVRVTYSTPSNKTRTVYCISQTSRPIL